MKDIKSVAVVGSGIAGLCLGHELLGRSIDCVVLDKGRAAGGRMATATFHEVPVNLGPMWFHARAERLCPEVGRALEAAGAISVDRAELPTDERLRLPDDGGVASWQIPGGMRALTRQLAPGLEILQSHHVRRLERIKIGWRLTGTDAAAGDQPFAVEASTVALTMPWPQVRQLLADSGMPIATKHQSDLPAEADYDPGHVLVYLVDAPAINGKDTSGFADIAGSGVVRRIVWATPPGEPGQRVMTVFASPAWSRDHFDASREHVEKALLEQAEAHFGQTLKATPLRHHRWKFARLGLLAKASAGPLVLFDEPLLIAAGEAFGQTVPGLTGLAAAQESARLAAAILETGRSGRFGC